MGRYNYGWQAAGQARMQRAMERQLARAQRTAARKAGVVEYAGINVVDGGSLRLYQVWYKSRRRGEPTADYEAACEHLLGLQAKDQPGHSL